MRGYEDETCRALRDSTMFRQGTELEKEAFGRATFIASQERKAAQLSDREVVDLRHRLSLEEFTIQQRTAQIQQLAMKHSELELRVQVKGSEGNVAAVVEVAKLQEAVAQVPRLA